MFLLSVFVIFTAEVCFLGSHVKGDSQSTQYAKITQIYREYSNLQRATCNYEVFVTGTVISNKIKPFWKSTGLCPPDPHLDAYQFLLSDGMQQNLFHVGSLPHSGITQVRIHWMLDLVQINVRRTTEEYRTPDEGSWTSSRGAVPVFPADPVPSSGIYRVLPGFRIIYNFTHLDELIFSLWKNDLNPGFELMGNPSNYFTDFENVTQVYMWQNLIKSVAEHYIALFGIKYVSKWNFETWNEPDHHDFDGLNFTIQGFLNYYDACSEGLMAADKQLRFGGPGGSCHIPSSGHNSPLCWSLLEHCVHGKNFFTGEIGVRLDFISFHKKGNGSSLLILDEELETIHFIKEKFPALRKVPFYNDEADPMKNWAISKWWRADVTYAAMVVKVILYHIQYYFTKTEIDDVTFGLLSNDNAFLSYFPNQFTERTLLARFQVNNTYPKYTEFIKKPVYVALGLLSKICPYVLDAKISKKGKIIEEKDFGIIVTRCTLPRKEITFVLYNSADITLSKVTVHVKLLLNFSVSNDSRGITLIINNKKTNPYSMWHSLGMPVYPSAKQFYLMKEKEGPNIKGPWKISSVPLKLHLSLLNPGVTVINICEIQNSLKKVKNVRFLQITNCTLQISWQDVHNRCVFSYYIEQSLSRGGPYFQLNKKNIIFPSYWHACYDSGIKCQIHGFYRIHAVDYWGKHGPYSVPKIF